MQHIGGQQKCAHDNQIIVRDRQRLGGVGSIRGDEQRDNVTAEQDHARRQQRGKAERQHKRRADTHSHAVKPVCAPVLAGVGRGGVAERGRGAVHQTVQLVGRGKTREEHKAAGVDNRLHDDAADDDDKMLQRKRQTKVAQSPDHTAVRLPVRLFDRRSRDFPQRNDAVRECKQLREQCRGGSARNAPAEADNEQQIEHNVQTSGSKHGNKRTFAVSECAEDRRCHVVRHRDERARIHHG